MKAAAAKPQAMKAAAMKPEVKKKMVAKAVNVAERRGSPHKP